MERSYKIYGKEPKNLIGFNSLYSQKNQKLIGTFNSENLEKLIVILKIRKSLKRLFINKQIIHKR